MPKIDKNLYTKRQFKLLQEQRRKEKQAKKAEIEAAEKQRIYEENKKILDEQKDYKLEKAKGKVAFVLGNGTSRKPIPLQNLKEKGKVYGCNALYRQFDPDYLVAVDTKMIIEINKTGWQKKHEVWTNPNKAYMRFKNFNYFNPSKGWSSGPTALWLASEHAYETIYIMGFDYRGLAEGTKFNNVYADTMNYKRSTDTATFFGNWMRQTQSVIQSNPKINYVRVVSDTCYIPKDFAKYSNLDHINIREFLKIIEDNE
jgi:hypothetical protein